MKKFQTLKVYLDLNSIKIFIIKENFFFKTRFKNLNCELLRLGYTILKIVNIKFYYLKIIITLVNS